MCAYPCLGCWGFVLVGINGTEQHCDMTDDTCMTVVVRLGGLVWVMRLRIQYVQYYRTSTLEPPVRTRVVASGRKQPAL